MQTTGGATAKVRGDEIQPGDVLLEAGYVERVVSIRPGATLPVLYATVVAVHDGEAEAYEVLFLRHERLTVQRAACHGTPSEDHRGQAPPAPSLGGPRWAFLKQRAVHRPERNLNALTASLPRRALVTGPSATADLQVAQCAGGFIYAPLPSGGAILHVEGAARPIYLRDRREVMLWTHGFTSGHQRATDAAQAVLHEVLAEAVPDDAS